MCEVLELLTLRVLLPIVEAREGARGYGGRGRCPDWDTDGSIVKVVSVLDTERSG